MRARRAAVNGSWMAQSMHATMGDAPATEHDGTARRRTARARSRPGAPGAAPPRARRADRIRSRP